MHDVDNILEKLEQEGYRPTEPRRVVLDDIVSRQAPLLRPSCGNLVQEHYPGIGRATVFRTLELLSRMGILQRIHQDPDGGRCHAYMVCGESHHHHLICSMCGNVTDFVDKKQLRHWCARWSDTPPSKWKATGWSWWALPGVPGAG